MNDNVTIIGAGRMGSALAKALHLKGFATTVWNRTSAKTLDLSRLGLRVAQSVEDSVREANIVVVSVSDYTSTRQLLEHPEIEDALRGKLVVQLSRGTPKEAREMDMWAHQCGISYRDGAILGSPEWIGTPACTIFYSGPAELFNRAKRVLMVFGDKTLFVGNEIGCTGDIKPGCSSCCLDARHARLPPRPPAGPPFRMTGHFRLSCSFRPALRSFGKSRLRH
jgi:3-hydroxyisobutyrate dehydrogenase-like beta-hydroxyacid dehydrogenase